mmetsp:Transcript_18821/g.30753  ORF Transcript_18821/g.30753 Transcript_18821/m.30753 type:complete len:316 (+) Transcript_18821:62-1009(+)|eukprot:CAMPEP_0203785552 /NCGR_PEP_ID=MMETSP0100_2-20121128/1098_1 /ASSEMBLY_ACC=CAM_ASM_000210 /TAXON_ID=96639 /ORGANISM=" , Strain NY0313808BC1" /LENGTH=315 /DNA_ID=CAMNT_0050687683 /DNA_START=59 /DNA_END=1006 /DNA_ORIENTATION=-
MSGDSRLNFGQGGEGRWHSDSNYEDDFNKDGLDSSLDSGSSASGVNSKHVTDQPVTAFSSINAAIPAYSFVGMQHTWSKTLFPGTLGTFGASGLREDTGERPRFNSSVSSRASPMQELFSSCQKETEFVNTGEIENLKSKIDSLEKDKERLIGAVLELQRNIQKIQVEWNENKLEQEEAANYSASLERENAGLRSQLDVFMQQYSSPYVTGSYGGAFPYNSAYSDVNIFIDSETGLQDLSKLHNQTTNYFMGHTGEYASELFAESPLSGSYSNTAHDYDKDDIAEDESVDEYGDDGEGSFRQYDDLEHVPTLQLG